MMKSPYLAIPLLAFQLWASPMAAADCHVQAPVVSHAVEGEFDSVTTSLKFAIQNQGLVLSGTSHLQEMLDVVERLGAETDYVRVDVLDLGDRFFIGELTNYPSSGLGQFRPHSFDFALGQHWTVPDSYG